MGHLVQELPTLGFKSNFRRETEAAKDGY